MALDNYSNDDESSGGPKKTTYYQFENPSHPESKEFADPERAQKHFDAAQYVQTKLGTDRHGLVGESSSQFRARPGRRRRAAEGLVESSARN
jgi:hypothetical protein